MLEAKRANGGLDPAETKAHEVATLRLYGAGASPKKFARLDAQQVDGVLRGQYRFAGAGQTGRMSSAAARRFRIWRATFSARMVLQKRRSSMRSPTAAATPTLAAAEPVDVPVARKLALTRTSRPRCRAGESICLVRLVGDRGADHALARRFARRREGPRYFPRQRSPTRRGQTSTRSPPPTSCTRIRAR